MVVKSRANSSVATMCSPVVAMETASYEADSDDVSHHEEDADMCSDSEGENGDVNDECNDEEDEDEDEESEEDDVAEPEDIADGAGKRGRKGASMRPPTADEMVSMRETQNLFHSNLFRLQTTEMLREITPPASRLDQLHSWLKQLSSWLLALPVRRRPCVLADMRWLANSGVRVPLLLDRLPEEPWHQLMMVCGAPGCVEPAGALKLGTLCRGGCVDVLVEMPSAAIDSKDVINARYLRKRAVYVAYLAWRLQSCPLVSNVRFSLIGDDALRPVVLLSPLLLASNETPRSHSYTVRLLVVPPGGQSESPLCAVERLDVRRSNVQSRWLCEGDSGCGGAGETKAPHLEKPTPHYNSLLLQDQLAGRLQQWRAGGLGKQQGDGSWKQALRLLAVWLRQRELLRDGIGGMLMSMLLLYLVNKRRVSPMMSAYQVMRTMWAHLSTTDWSVEGITLVETPLDSHPPIGEFHQHYDVVFVDPTGHLNLAAALPLHTYQRLRDESARALLYLDSAHVDSFRALFMSRVPFVETFDHVVVLEIDPSRDVPCRSRPVGGSVTALLQRIVATLRHGLADRVSLIDVQRRDVAPPDWLPGEDPPLLRPVPVCVGVRVAPERLGSTVDRGPEPGSGRRQEEMEFRRLWGDKVQTRRFQDGQIQLAVVWPAVTTTEKRLIPRQIVLHLLQLHHQIDPASVGFCSDGVECLLSDTRLLPAVCSGAGYGCGESCQLQFISVHHQLSCRLRQLQRLPLVVTGVVGLSAAHRHAAPFPPLPDAQHALVGRSTRYGSSQLLERQSELGVPHCSPLDVLIQLEISGKWPTDQEAVRRVITAFHLQVCEELRQLGYTVSCRRDSVLLLFEGYMFRLRVANPRLRHQKHKQQQEQHQQEHHECGDVGDDHQMTLLTSALAGLQGQYPAYSTACRLAVRWLNGHMMSDLFPDIVAELIMADVFVCPAPYPVTQQPCAALLRWWRRLASWDWQNRPLVVDIDGALSSASDKSGAAASFSTVPRHTLPPLVIYTGSDRSGTALTSHSPTAAVMVHAQKLAWKSLQQVSQCLTLVPDPRGPAIDWRVAFRPAPADTFHLIVHVYKRQCLARHQAVDPCGPVRHVDAYERRQYEALLPAGPSPIAWLLRRLRAAFGSRALFWHDKFGGATIGVLLRPGCLAPRPFSITQVAGCGPEGGAGQMAFSVHAMAEYIRVLGAGIVESVEVNTDKLAELEV